MESAPANDRLAALLAFYEEDPDDAFTRFALAQEYLKRGRDAEALRFFEALRAEVPEYVGTYYHLGKLYERLSRTDAALAVYRDGIAVAGRQGALHDQAELRGALLEAEGLGFDD